MDEINEVKRGRGRPKLHPEIIYEKSKHSCYLLQFHMVLVTENCCPIISGDIETRMHEIIEFILGRFECKPIEIITKENYVEVLFEATPVIDLSVLANNIKTVTSRRLRKEYPAEVEKYYQTSSFWTKNYFVGTISEKTEIAVNQYIKMKVKN